MARSLDENLWGEAFNYVVFTINQTGTSAVKGKSPAELWFSRKMDVSKLKTFGYDCYVLIEDHRRGKTEKKSIKGIFVGYDIDSPDFRVYAENLRDILSSSNMIFDEKTGIEGFTELEMPSTDNSVQTVEVQEISDEGSEHNSFETGESENERSSENVERDEESEEENSSENFENENQFDSSDSRIENCQVPVRRKLRDRRTPKAPAKYDDYVMGSALMMKEIESAMIGEVRNENLNFD